METVTWTAHPDLPAAPVHTYSRGLVHLQTGSPFAALTVLELALQARLASSSERNLPRPPSAGIRGARHLTAGASVSVTLTVHNRYSTNGTHETGGAYQGPGRAAD